MSQYRYKLPAPLTKEEEKILQSWGPSSLLGGSVLLLVVGAYLLAVGIGTQILNERVKSFEIEYNTETVCPNLNEYCTIDIDLPEDFKEPVFVYYHLYNFNQNYKTYLESVDMDQIFGKESDSAWDRCKPYVTNGQMGKDLSINGDTPLEPADVAIPCGLRAQTYFQDTYSLWSVNEGIPVEIDETDIAWDEDKKNFKNTDLSKQWVNLETDEHFMVWMRPAGLGDFKKLWGRINRPLDAGKYQLTIFNQFDTLHYNSQKYFNLISMSPIGDKNPVLAISHLVVGSLFIVISTVLSIMHSRKNKNE